MLKQAVERLEINDPRLLYKSALLVVSETMEMSEPLALSRRAKAFKILLDATLESIIPVYEQVDALGLLATCGDTPQKKVYEKALSLLSSAESYEFSFTRDEALTGFLATRAKILDRLPRLVSAQQVHFPVEFDAFQAFVEILKLARHPEFGRSAAADYANAIYHALKQEIPHTSEFKGHLELLEREKDLFRADDTETRVFEAFCETLLSST